MQDSIYTYTGKDVDVVYFFADKSKIIDVHGPFGNVVICPYCKGYLEHWVSRQGEDGWDIHRIKFCKTCGWWREAIIDYDNVDITNIVSLLRKRPFSDEALPLSEIRSYLSKNWKLSKSLTPQKAEDVVRNVFQDYLNCEIHYLTNSVYTPDKGIDFVLINSDKGLLYAFQVKRRLTNKPESVKEVREFIGAVAMSSYEHGYYVTFADRFSKVAFKEIEDAERVLDKRNLHISLVDGTRLREIISNQNPVAQGLDELQKGRNKELDWWWSMTDIKDDDLLSIPLEGGKTITQVLRS